MLRTSPSVDDEGLISVSNPLRQRSRAAAASATYNYALNDNQFFICGDSTSQPEAVTTTTSSIRTPHFPGTYTPGSIVITIPGSQLLALSRCQSGRFVYL